MKSILLLSILCLLSACQQGRDTVVNPHEQKKEGANSYVHPNQTTLQFRSLSFGDLQKTLNSSKRNSDVVISQVIQPLEQNLFNLKTILNPEVVSGDFHQWLDLYTESLYEVAQFHSSKTVDAKLNGFINLAMHECNANLDNCQLINTFNLSANSSRLFILKANRVGAEINNCILSETTRSCSSLITQKYRLLAFSRLLNVSVTRNDDFLASYLEHANLLLELNYDTKLHKTSVALFLTLFQSLDGSGNQCELVKKFDSWTYSKTQASNNSEISKKLFSLATSCDLYGKDGKLSASFWNSMKAIQLDNSDPNTISFYRRLLQIRRNKNEMEAANKLGLGLLISKATSRTTQGALNQEFYNEYFYALDRFYNGHIILEDTKQILLGANRDYTVLLQTFNDYLKLKTFVKIVDSKQFFKTVIDRNQAIISSEKLFERSILDSEPLAQEWSKLQSGFNQLYTAVKFVVEKQNSQSLKTQLDQTESQFKNLAQTLRIMVTYPAMHMLAHLISEAQGSVTVRTFWGTFNKSAITVFQELWSGVQQPWFRFVDDSAPINKFYLLYALDYNLKGNFVLIQKDADKHDNAYLRGRFFSVLINKYIGKTRSELYKKFVTDFRSKRNFDPMTVQNAEFCSYELDPQVKNAPSLTMPVENFPAAIYSGQSDKTSSNYLAPTLSFITNMKSILDQVHNLVKPRIEYARQMLHVAESNGVPADALKEAKAELQKLEDLTNEAINYFAADFKRQKNCFLRMTLVEQSLQYLVMENERAYLSQVHADMAQLQNKQGVELSQLMQSIHNQSDRYKDVNQVYSKDAQQNFFDAFTNKTGFTYSQYDFLMRLTKYFGDSNLSPSTALMAQQEALRKKFPEIMRKPLFLNRNWSIVFPPDARESVLFNDRSADMTLTWNEDREVFIRQGLSALNKKSKPFTTWLVENNDIARFKTLIETAGYLYALTNSSSKHTISTSDVFQSMEEMVSFVSLTDYDITAFQDLGLESRTAMESMKDIFLDSATRPGSASKEVLSESIHPFTFLYDSLVQILNINNTIFKENLTNANLMADQPLENAYLFSTVLNNDAFKMSFQVHNYLEKKLHEEYKTATRQQIDKIVAVRKMFKDRKDKKYSASVFRVVDKELITFESASSTSLSTDLIHPQKYSNLLIFIREFNQSTKNVYGTGELLKTLDAQ